MIIDILTAFVVALLLEMLTFGSKHLKRYVIFVFCMIIAFVYFVGRVPVAFIGEIDLAIWMALVIIYDTFLNTLIEKIWRKNDGVR